MRCPKCGNEVNQDESFCGQCGAPTMQLAHPTEMIYTPPHSGLLSSYQTNNTHMPPMPASPSNAYNNGMVPPPNTYNPNLPPGGTAVPPNQPAAWPINPEQQSGFYQDATEAMSVMPGNGQGFQTGHPQQGVGGYPGAGQFGPQAQPFPPGSYTQHGGFTPITQFPPGGLGYGYGVLQPSPIPPPAKKSQAHAGIVIASICLAVALISLIVFGALYLARGRSSPNASITPTPVATAAPSPTVVPTPSPTATATPVPSPTAVPTPAPDANFTWCGATCAADGFIVEYPLGWNEGQTSDKTGLEFLNPSQQDEYAAFKLPATPAGSIASQLVDTDLQSTFSAQPGYIAPTSKAVTTIGGETWTYAIAYYLLNNQQKERVEVFATIHSAKGYVIELQAADSQFDAVNTQYFAYMLGRFQFHQGTS